jgi:glycosyltransferase involved in cell wall biosynthesis
MVCRLIEQKGVTYALQAFARVADRFPAARLIIAGDGVLRGQLEAEADSLGIGGRVHWLGWRPDSAAVLASLDVLLMPSLWEGFGLVMLEAMAAHLPIIGSRVSAIPEVVVDGETGLLVPPADVSALAAALSRLLEDEPLRRAMGERGAERLAAHFSTAAMIDATIGLYQALLRGK